MIIDTAEAVLILVLVVLTALLVVLGIQVFFILRGVRETIAKANKVLDDTGSITESVSGPIGLLSDFSTNVKVGSLFAIIKIVKGLLEKEKTYKGKEK